MLRDKKGISLITAVMTVLIIIIILSTITYTAINNTKVKKINEFYSDLRLITDEVQLYYAEHDKLPVDDIFYTVTESYIQKEVNGVFEAYSSLETANIEFILKDGKTDYSFENLYNPNDYDTSGDVPKSVYYQIDLSKFDNLTLSNPDCIYLVNEQSKTVYCYEGVKVNGEIHHKLPLDYIDAVPTFALVFMLAAGAATVYLSKQKATAVYYPTEKPTRDGYEFTGWYYDEECTQIAKEGTPLKEDVTLYAGWKEAAEDEEEVTDANLSLGSITNKINGAELSEFDYGSVTDKTLYTYTTSKAISSCTIVSVDDAGCVDYNAYYGEYTERTDSVSIDNFTFTKETSTSASLDVASINSGYMHKKRAILSIRIDFTDGTYDTDTFIARLCYSCIVEGTKIKLADRTYKNIEDITYEDELLVWDFDNGVLASSKPLWIMKKQVAGEYNLLKFENGSELKTVDQHRIFNKDSGKFTYPMTEETPIGTTTVTSDGTETKLISKEKVQETVNYYNIITDYHMNLFAEDILTSCRLSNLYEVKDMKYVKDNRELASKEEYPNIPEEYFKGLRIAEQPKEVNRGNDNKHDKDLEGYVQRLIKNRK